MPQLFSYRPPICMNFLLLSLSTLAILYEIANPGVGAGGVTGAVALILGLYSLSVLPVNFPCFYRRRDGFPKFAR